MVHEKCDPFRFASKRHLRYQAVIITTEAKTKVWIRGKLQSWHKKCLTPDVQVGIKKQKAIGKFLDHTAVGASAWVWEYDEVCRFH